MQLELIDVLVEIGTAGGLHAEAAAAERDFVEIKLEDLLLGQRILDAHRKDCFTHFAPVAQFVRQQQVFRHLLRDRRSADGTPTARQIGKDRGRDPRIVDTAMAEEGLVFGREERANEQLRIFAIFQLDAPFAGIAVNRLAFAVANHCRKWRFISAKLIDRRQVACKHHPDQGEEKNPGERKIAKPAEPAPCPHIAEPCDDGIAVAAQAQAKIGRTVSGHMSRL